MKTKPEDFQFFINRLNGLDPDELKRRLESDHEQSEKEFELFSKSFSNGDCYLCLEKITRCNYSKPCIHWLLRAHKGVKKKHIEHVLKSKDLFQVIAYLRWLANYESRLRNVNDFEAYEERKGLVYQETIKYGQITWTFWIKDGDLTGHGKGQVSFPHYHLHMTINDESFISFGDMHIQLSEWDIFNIHAYRGKYEKLSFIVPHGETYSDLFNFVKGEQIVKNMITAKDEGQAQFHLETFVEAEPGKTLKGEDIEKIIKESKRTGVPLATLAKNLGGRVETRVTPINLVDSVLRDKSKGGR